MDCETFERIVLDRVFLELDELTMGAAQRHVAHCSRCRTIEVGLRATRDVCRLPQVVPMEGFADCVISFERQIHAVLPFRQRVSRVVSVLASYAMRPQPTMAVLLLLMIGASLFLVRTRPAERDLVQVTERGVPEVDIDPGGDKNAALANSPVSAPPSAEPDVSSRPTTTGPSSAGRQRDENCAAHGSLDSGCAIDGSPLEATDSKLPLAELEAARAVRKAAGCEAAIQPLEVLRQKTPTSEVGQAATLEAAECYVKTNRPSEARALFESLVDSPRFGHRAKTQLEAMDTPQRP